MRLRVGFWEVKSFAGGLCHRVINLVGQVLGRVSQRRRERAFCRSTRCDYGRGPKLVVLVVLVVFMQCIHVSGYSNSARPNPDRRSYNPGEAPVRPEAVSLTSSIPSTPTARLSIVAFWDMSTGGRGALSYTLNRDK